MCGKLPKSAKKCRADFALYLLPFSFSLSFLRPCNMSRSIALCTAAARGSWIAASHGAVLVCIVSIGQ